MPFKFLALMCVFIAAACATTASLADTGGWKIVGLWNYDASDGQYLSEGLIIVEQTGSNAGKQWTSHIELKAHSKLLHRDRSLWPVSINYVQRKVCADYPGYPTYSAQLDLPGTENDGMYLFQKCRADGT